MLWIQVFAVLGIILSIYAFVTEYKLKHKRSYKPVCDISKEVSCSKAFLSKYGKLGGISNSLVGIFYYLVIFLFANDSYYLFLLTFAGLISSILLAYLSFVKLKIFCLVCNAIYIVNLILFILALSAF